MAHAGNTQNKKRIAEERIRKLFELAQKEFSKHHERSHRYVQLARKIAMKTRYRLPSNLKRKFCRHCYKFLQPGINARVRTKNHKVVYYCLSCKKHMRFQLSKKLNL